MRAHYTTLFLCLFLCVSNVLSLGVCQRGQIEFEVVYVAPEVDSDDENVEYEDDSGHHYRLYLDELDNNSSTAPPSNSSASLQGKCVCAFACVRECVCVWSKKSSQTKTV